MSPYVTKILIRHVFMFIHVMNMPCLIIENVLAKLLKVRLIEKKVKNLLGHKSIIWISTSHMLLYEALNF